MDTNLQERIGNMEYQGYIGESAIEQAYTRIFERYDQPKTEPDLLMTVLNPDGFRNLFALYFAIHPEEARQIVNEHASYFKGLRRLLEPFAYFGNPVRSIRYQAARQQVIKPVLALQDF